MKAVFSLLFLAYTITASAQYRHDSIRTDKGCLHFYTKGAGKPIALLQGGPGASHHYMRGIADSITGYQTILIDYQGTGLSNYNNADTTWVTNESIINDIELVRKQLNIEKWTLIGHSYGGMFALYYGVTYPHRTEKIITIANSGTNHHFQEHLFENKFTRLSLEERKRMRDFLDLTKKKLAAKEPAPESMETQLLMLQPEFYDTENIQKLFAAIPREAMSKVNSPRFHRAYWDRTYSDRRKNKEFDITPQVLGMDIPVRMIESWQDPGYDGRQLLLHHQLKNSKIEFINESGHFAWIEQPEVFFRILKKYITEESATAENQIKQVIRGVFDTIFSNLDTASFDTYCTKDFLLLEDGKAMNADSVKWLLSSVMLPKVQKLRSEHQQVERINDFDFIDISWSGNTARVAYHNYARITIDGKVVDAPHWLESAVLTKTDARWKIQLLHSTLLKE